MGIPVNFDSVSLDGILSDWVAALREFSVEAVVISRARPLRRQRRPPGGRRASPQWVAEAAKALAESRDFGARWRDSDAPLVAWQNHFPDRPRNIRAAGACCGWAHGYQTVVRVEFSLRRPRLRMLHVQPARADRPCRSRGAGLVALNIWPQVRRSIAHARSTLSPRERECLELAFQGLTARESSQRLLCSERTINYHLANAMSKLKVDNKMAAIQRACWLGAI
jgi:DNA-binding CsgD family transcriptional regulator